MSATPISKRRLSVEEFYVMEDAAQVRHEFHDGEILAMSGGSITHARIIMNLSGEVRARLKGSPCEPFGSDLRARIEASNRVVYPDLSIVCGPVERDLRDKANGTIMNPRVVFEVLSPSTERYDRTEKRDHYLTLPSLDAHVLIDQDRPRVEVLSRTADGRWELSFATGLDALLRLPMVQIEIPLRDLYDRVEFPPPTPPIPNE